MLKDILNLINETSLYSDAYISKKLNIRKDVANDMVENLIRMGYLIEDLGSPSCETSCSKCAYARSCNTTPVKTFTISSKGRKLLEIV